ncbi:uncharacterized protein LOC5505291 isoform X2 [Nematostella vectensis]|uniref:uncharacterized protein LOC5505291 isoform X2 n=1 Tax=Nematostella vectensis TaxID=45351 RepID=UPI0020776B5C|nr:uncharacterized protein LOC5505291 isoform X2 [Nematostella vectensis]
MQKEPISRSGSYQHQLKGFCSTQSRRVRAGKCKGPRRKTTNPAQLPKMCVTPKAWLTLCLCMLVYSSAVADPLGHMMPLGSHQPKEGDVESRDDMPSPSEFYHNYVLASKPVIFRGAAKSSKGFNLWTDAYLRKKYGHEIVRVDYGKKENRARSADDMPLEEFLDIYNSSERYLVDTLPERMWEEFSLPECLLCGGFTHALQDSVLWFSSGGTKSHLHNDKVENINCLFSGEKVWFFVDQIHSQDINMDHKEGDYCSANVDKVDMYQYPFLQHIPWWQAHMHAGDCMYVPYGWAHQVTSSSRNVAVNIWWSPGIKFNPADCQDKKQPELSNYKFTYGVMLKFQAVQHEHTGDMLITREHFALLDTDGNGQLTATEVNSLSPSVVEEAFGHTPPGEVNLVGRSRPRDQELLDILASLPKQPPHVEEFLLRYEKTEDEIEQFLSENELPSQLRAYVHSRLEQMHSAPLHQEL